MFAFLSLFYCFCVIFLLYRFLVNKDEYIIIHLGLPVYGRIDRWYPCDLPR